MPASSSSSLGAYKPFVTEYKLSFKDPRSTKKRTKKNAVTVGDKPQVVSTAQQQQQQQQVSFPRTIVKDKDSGGGVFPTLLPNNNAISLQQSGPARARRSKSTKNLWAPPAANEKAESTSLSLPGMMIAAKNSTGTDGAEMILKTFRRRRVLNPVDHATAVHKHRYNIISGNEIMGEAYSGYKEGRRAVIQTFAHIDMTTNARTPGYNIISNHDYLADQMDTLSVA
ncbi:hypothetical protein HK100_006785 [Physocladia obscura]|uniref:Uncharacterized protein n=1 Tax=Physocladia obscura TaxID=109957 RepID=A0AAD5SVP3_9FUNG|nr:hypothetical protein HK100_006785 [Physocladia obscura]